MNVVGSGFITIINYASGGGLVPSGAILTESAIPITAEDGNILIIE